MSTYGYNIYCPSSINGILLLGNELLMEIESDSYWCFTLLLEGLQTNYTYGQPGIQNMVQLLQNITRRLNSKSLFLFFLFFFFFFFFLQPGDPNNCNITG